MIQRCYRQLKARKELRERRKGLTAPVEDELNLPEDTGRVKKHKQELEQTKRYVESQFSDNFYRKIEEHRKKELLDEVIKRRKIIAESDLKNFNISKIRLDYN